MTFQTRWKKNITSAITNTVIDFEKRSSMTKYLNESIARLHENKSKLFKQLKKIKRNYDSNLLEIYELNLQINAEM